MDEAERRFEQQSTGKGIQEHRRGDHIDPEQGEAAYHDVETATGAPGPLARAKAPVATAKAHVTAATGAAKDAVKNATKSVATQRDDAPADAERLFHIYLRDHHAADVAGLALAHRALQNNAGSEYEAELRTFVEDIEEDSKALRMAMAELGIEPSPVKMLVARGSEFISRLKTNGRIVHYSPSSRVLEFEGLAAGLAAKQQFWRSLTVAKQDVIPADQLDHLIERAGDQAERVDALHARAARTAFVA
jgi:hypothetical protein